MNQPTPALQSLSPRYTDNERRLFYPARVMTPTEVEQATMKYPDRVRRAVLGKWFLCGDLSPGMFDMVRRNLKGDLPARLTAFASPTGVSYGVVSHQFCGYAHRFILPLYEPKASELLHGIGDQPLMYMFGRDEDTEALVFPGPFGATAFLPMLAMAHAVEGEQLHDALAELPDVIHTLKQPMHVPSISGEQVTRVDVSVLLPTQSLKRFWGVGAEGAR